MIVLENSYTSRSRMIKNKILSIKIIFKILKNRLEIFQEIDFYFIKHKIK